jgi:hypothetical protein
MPEGTVSHQAPCCPMMEAPRRDAPQSTSASETAPYDGTQTLKWKVVPHCPAGLLAHFHGRER